jgi:hypothetical protein
VFREKSYSLRVHNAAVKAFFQWAIRFDYLQKDPMSKLDAVAVTPVPTLPLQNDEYPRMLAAVNVLPSALQHKILTHMLLMRWSGLAIRDASCLPVDALSADNRLRTYRQKTGKYVYIKLPDFVADALRIEAKKNAHPGYFFWQKSKMGGKSQAECSCRNSDQHSARRTQTGPRLLSPPNWRNRDVPAQYLTGRVSGFPIPVSR